MPPAPPLWPWCPTRGRRRGSEQGGSFKWASITCTLIVPIKVWMPVNRVTTWNKICRNGSRNKRVSSLPLYSPPGLRYHNTITSSLFHDRFSKGKSSKRVKEYDSLIFIVHGMTLIRTKGDLTGRAEIKVCSSFMLMIENNTVDAKE